VDLRDYLAVLRRHLLLLAAVFLVCVGAATFLTVRATPQYASSSQLFVSAAGTDGSNSAFQGSQFALQRVKSYANLNRLAVAQRVVTRLNLDRSPQALAGQVTTSAVPDTVLLTVTVRDSSQREAQRLSQAFSEELVKYVIELESTGEDESSASVSLVGAASTSSSPVSPNPVRNLLLGAALGLVLGAAAATLRENLDSTIRSTGRLEKTVDAPCLGIATHDSSTRKHPLLSGLDPYSPRVESFRVLRTNLQFLSLSDESLVLQVAGATPGSGSSTVAANFAESLADAGRDVMLIEADMRDPVIASYFAVDPALGLSTVLSGSAQLDDVIQSIGSSSLDVITSGGASARAAELLQSETMADLITALRARYEYVIIDSPTLVPFADAALCAAQADGTILIVEQGRTDVGAVALGLERLHGVDGHVVGTVLLHSSGIRGFRPNRGAASAPAPAAPIADPAKTDSDDPENAEADGADDQRDSRPSKDDRT